MTAIILWLVSKGLPLRYARVLVPVLAGLLALGLLWGLWSMIVHRHDAKVIETHEQVITNRLTAQATAADAKLEERKAADTVNAAAERQEFNNATASLPPSGLSNRQHIDACRELRAQGTAPAVLARARCL